MVEAYTDLIKLMFLGMIYSPLIPIGLIYMIIGISFSYYFLKIYLFTARRVDYILDHTIAEGMLEFLEYLLPLFCVNHIKS